MGETVVLASGESAGGYTVLAIDDDEGVRVRTPDGGTIKVGVIADQTGPRRGRIGLGHGETNSGQAPRMGEGKV